MTHKLYLFIAATVLLNLSNAVKVSEEVCTKDSGTECSTIGHAECNNAASNAKCKCSDGYKEDSGDGSTCVKVKVSETVCTKDTGTECTTIGHAECDNAVSDAKCKCSDGYKEDSGDGSTCVKVFGSACTGTSACTGDANLICKTLTCACKDGFSEKNDVCTKTVSGTTCTANGEECKTITNAECDSTAAKCKCSPGFTMNVDTCAAENAAAAISVGGITLALYGFLAVVKILG